MHEEHKAVMLISERYFNIPNETHAESFTRAKMFAIEALHDQIKLINRMKIEDYKRLR
jgi:hypothetical protein